MDKIIYKFKRYKNAVWSRVRYFVAINKLQIKNSGVNSDGVPFVEIENGLIRIQVNGAELETLKGMRRTLKKSPKLSVALIYEKEKKQKNETVSLFLKDLDYKMIKTGGSIFAYK